MSISRRQFLLGTSAGLILPAFYDKVFSYFENHNEPLLYPPKCTEKILYACADFAEGFQLNLGDPYAGPPAMTVRQFCEVYGWGDPEKWWREWHGLEEDEWISMEGQMEPDIVFDWWLRKDSSIARAYRFLESIDLGPELKDRVVVGQLVFIDGACPGNDYLGVEANDGITLSLLQQRLNELESRIEVRLA